MSRAYLVDVERPRLMWHRPLCLPVTLHGATGYEFTIEAGETLVIHEVEAGGPLGASTRLYVAGCGPLLCRETREEVLGLVRAARMRA